jgi:hypothetical protein
MTDPKDNELRELHELYGKHEPIAYACIFNATTQVIVYACPCGGTLNVSAILGKVPRLPESLYAMKYPIQSKDIRREWLEPMIKLASKCKPVGQAWARLNQASAGEEYLDMLEEKYGLRQQPLKQTA